MFQIAYRRLLIADFGCAPAALDRNGKRLSIRRYRQDPSVGAERGIAHGAPGAGLGT